MFVWLQSLFTPLAPVHCAVMGPALTVNAALLLVTEAAKLLTMTG